MIIYKITGENVTLAKLHFSTKKVNNHAFVKMRNYSNAEFCVWCPTLSSPSPLSLICNGPRDQKKRQALRTRMDVQKMHSYNEIINAQVSVICIRADRVCILLVFAWFYLASRWALERLLSSWQSSLTWVASDCTPTISSAEKRGRVLLNVVLWDALAKAKDYRPSGSWKFIKPRSTGGT